MLSVVVGSCLSSAESAIDGRSKGTNKKAYAAFVLWLPEVALAL